MAWASAIDLRSLRLPDALTLPLIPLGLVVSAYRVGDWPSDYALAALAGFAAFYVLGEAYFRARGVEGLGIGDAKLLTAAGAWLGPSLLPAVVLGAALPAIVVVMLRGRARPIAFGPYLSAAFFAAWLWVLSGSM